MVFIFRFWLITRFLLEFSILFVHRGDVSHRCPSTCLRTSRCLQVLIELNITKKQQNLYLAQKGIKHSVFFFHSWNKLPNVSIQECLGNNHNQITGENKIFKVFGVFFKPFHHCRLLLRSHCSMETPSGKWHAVVKGLKYNGKTLCINI